MKYKLLLLGLLFLTIRAMPALAQSGAGTITASGSTCATAGACVILNLPLNSGASTIVVSGTFSATLQFELTGTLGATPVSLNCFPPNSTTAATSTTSTGTWRCNVASSYSIQVRASALASGSAVISISASPASANSIGGSGGGGGGGVTSVSGTANQVDVATGTTTPVISLDAAITLPGSLTAPTGGSITFSGTGTNNANELNGTLLSGLATGLLKNTTTTGVPSIATSSDILAACTTCVTSAAALTNNILTKGGGLQAAQNSSITDNGTTVSTAEALSVLSVATNSDGVHPSSVQLVGNTTLPSLTGNTVTLLGFPAATNTAWSFQFPTAIPTTTDLFSCVVTSTNCVLTDSGVASGNVVTAAATLTSGRIMEGQGTKTSAVDAALDDGVTTANTLTYTGTSGLAVPKVTTTGTTAGFMDFPQGSTSAAVAPCNTATSICEQAPTAVTSYLLNKPGAAPDISSYKQTDGCGSAICTESFHPVPVLLTVASDFTDSTSTSLQLVTGLSTTMPVSKAVVISGHCGLLFDQATAAVSDSIGIGVTGTAPSSANASATSYTSASVTATGTLVSLASTTPTAVVTFTPSAITTVWKAEVDFTVEQPSNATPGIFGIYVSTTTGTDNLIVKRGSYCSVTYQ